MNTTQKMIQKEVRKVQENSVVQLPSNLRGPTKIKPGDHVIVGLDTNKNGQLIIAVLKPETTEDKEYLKLFDNNE